MRQRTYIKTKRAQYYDRRQSGRTPEDAAKRTYLSRSAAWRYERDYLAFIKKKHADALAAQMAERIDASKRREDDNARAAAKTAKVVPEAPRPPRCRLCGSDHCHCETAKASASAFEPVSDYGFIDPIAGIDPRLSSQHIDGGLPPEFLTALADQATERFESGIWSPEKGYVTDSDQAEQNFRDRAEAERQQSRQIITSIGSLRTGRR